MPMAVDHMVTDIVTITDIVTTTDTSINLLTQIGASTWKVTRQLHLF
jgi:hypothetical protein